MSLNPPEAAGPARQRKAIPAWHMRAWTLCFAIFCLEIGGFLAAFPWLNAWHSNHFPALVPWVEDIWSDPYFRGAVSGIGLVNLLIAALQVTLLYRKS